MARRPYLCTRAPATNGFHRMRFLTSTLAVWLLALGASPAAEEGAHHGPPMHAERIWDAIPITNSMVMIWIVAAVLILVAQLATRNLALVPSGLQNLVEWAVESLYNFLEGILGKHLVHRTFWFFGTIFILILSVNWLGLIPGMGSIGWELHSGGPKGPEVGFLPFLRGGNADLNMTGAMAFTFAILWFYWAITENGLKGFLAHIFAPKGKFSGLMSVMMLVVFFAVGLLEVVSILFRPVALTFRLYGNSFAGENILESMVKIVGKKYEYLGWLPPIPFYFMELLVGLIQALVFMLLTAVFLKLICDHGDDHDHAEAH